MVATKALETPDGIDEVIIGEGSLFLNMPKIEYKIQKKFAIKCWGPLSAGFLGVFNIGPKWTFQCQDCGHGWKERLLIGINEPIIKCPDCGNICKMTKFKWNDGI